MAAGFIKLHRVLINKPIWHLSTPEQKCILITLLCLASHDENQWEWMGQKFKVLPGQFVTSLDSIRKATGKGISIQNVRSSLERFKKLQFLTYQATKAGRVISICNWQSYQHIEKGTQQRKEQTGNKGATTIKNVEEGKEDKKNNNIALFEEFWNLYGKKEGKKQCMSKWGKLPQADIENILIHVPAYVKSTPDEKFRKNPLTYLTGEHWNDEIPQAKVVPGQSYPKQHSPISEFDFDSLNAQRLAVVQNHN